MKYNIFIFLFCFVFLTLTNVNPQIRNKEIDTLFENKKKQLSNLENELKLLKEEENKILRLYLFIVFTKSYSDNLAKFFENPEYLKILDEDTKIKILENALIKKLKSLKEKQKILSAEKENVLKEIAKLKKNIDVQLPESFYMIDPLFKKPLKPGKYFLKIETFTYIHSPMSGTIKSIAFKPEGISIIIENEKCKFLIKGLDDIKINIGDKVTIKEIIGTVKENKNLIYDIQCNK